VLLKREPVRINGDGETSRDFLSVADVAQANLLAATTTKTEAVNQAYNVAQGERTTLNELFLLLQKILRRTDPSLPDQKPVFQASGLATCAIPWPTSAKPGGCWAMPDPKAGGGPRIGHRLVPCECPSKPLTTDY